MSDSTFSLYSAGLGLMLGLGTVTVVDAAADDGCRDAPCSIAKSEDASALEEIVVTGSHIRGAESAGSKVILISREQIDASGYGRVEDVLATVTQNFNRANAAVGEPEHGIFNLNHGAEVQLRGLGVGTTLTLVNGQRQGASGYQGTFTDVSTIPVSAIERIEILPEGSAALYGSDAIGGVVNIVLRKDFEGVEVRVRGSATDSDATERSAALLLGHAGSRGHVLAGVQFNDSDALRCSEREYCAANGDLRRFGGTDLRNNFASNPGTILDPNTRAPIAAIPRGQDGTQLTPAQLIPGTANYTDDVTGNDILPRQIMRSAFASASYKVTEQWEISADGRFSSRDSRFTFPVPPDAFLVPVTNAFNHLGGPVLVAYDFSRDFGPVVDTGPTKISSVSAAVKGVLPKGWQINFTGAYSKASAELVETNYSLNYPAIDAALASSDPATALNIFGDGSHTNATVLAALRRQNITTDDLNVFTTTSANVIADGPLLNWHAGVIRLAVGGEFRHEHSAGINISENPEDRERLIRSGFFELAVPMLGPPPSATVDRLDLSLAGRYDSYSDVGSTFNPKVGFSWRPLALIKLRGNWGTSFRAPPYFYSNHDQVGDAAIQNVIDPRSPTGYTPALLLYGPLPDLKPETGRAWTAGVDLTARTIPLSLSVTYFDIDYQGKIEHPGPDTVLFLTQEAQLAPLITRNPTQAQIDAVCTRKPLFGACNQPIAAILDGRWRNLASLKTRGVDAAVDYLLHTAWGKVRSSLNGTYMIDQRQQIFPTAPVFDLVDTVGNPPSLRLVGNLSWSLKGWTVQSTVNYTGAYRDPGSVPTRNVDSWTTVDVNIGYRVDGGSGWLANTQSNLGINNALDHRPPFVNQFDLNSGTLGYDPANASLLGRQVSLQVMKRWGQ